MMEHDFNYVIYLRTTPEKLWHALTDGELTRRYWYGRRVESDWKVGSPVTFWAEGNPETVADTGEVLEIESPRKLAFSWQPQVDAEMKAEPHSKVTLELEPVGTSVRLTVNHGGFHNGSKVRAGCARPEGWPAILSSLKSFIETGAPLSVTKTQKS